LRPSLSGSMLSEEKDYRRLGIDFQPLFVSRLQHAGSIRSYSAFGTSSFSTPRIYGRNATGTVTDPSAFWKFSSTATSVRPTASPDPFNV